MSPDIGTDRRVQILINPSARSGRGQAALHALLRREPALRDMVCIDSQSAAHFAELVQAAQDPAAGLDALAIAGGDGTLTLALAALTDCEQRVPLCVLPTGSGNDFVNDLCGERSLANALRVLRHGQPRWVDIGEAAPPHGPPQPFCCVASVGLDELALRRIHGSRFPRSQALNLSAALAGLWQYQPRRVVIAWQGGEYRGEIMFAAVTNTRSYGGGFRVSPASRLDDGLLDLCIVPAMPKAKLLWHFPRILRGTHGTLPGLILAQSPWVHLDVEPTSGTDLPLCIDGDLPQSSTPVTLRCLPRRLQVLAPPTVSQPQVPPIATPFPRQEAA